MTREVYRTAGVPDADAAVIFFHGLGLSHMDIELTTADGKPNDNWALEEGMVVPLHFSPVTCGPGALISLTAFLVVTQRRLTVEDSH